MELLLNGINGNYPLNILLKALKSTERVDAAVAYATENDLLFNWCWDNKIPLRYWGRFDEDVPVSIPVLTPFLLHKSGNYVCKLVRSFHPKVIWWRGYGAYIGSANLTQPAWWGNVEAGVFISDDELSESGHDLQLEAMFEEIDRHAAPLTQELYNALVARNNELTRRKQNNRTADETFLKSTLVPFWEGLAKISSRSAQETRRQAFLDEWHSTLQIIRNIGAKISTDKNRPSWVDKSAPLGAHADQFLHAHYYQRTFDRGRADYQTHFTRNRKDTDAAEQEAIGWWRTLKSTQSEQTMLNETAPFLRTAFSDPRLSKLTEDEFVQVLSCIHAAREYARRAPNRFVGLSDGKSYKVPEKIEALARYVYNSPSRGGPSVLATLQFVLHDGNPAQVPHRLWDAMHDPKRKIELIGISTIGEIVGWALPDMYPPRNGRTSKALRSHGHNVTVHVG
ncbi:phospholipase D family protein [Rhizobium laguerreae]|uniref:phospholipase D family protein n=1 Tax=Rhizobium laguerreae TaxID=1076926 RepID=UPI0021B11474|nr:phospholipase D family protein [Rhizobium laguerreae]MBY3168873.1 phospholipase [Rhizobium laguerreae]